MIIKSWFAFAVRIEAEQYAAQYPNGRPITESSARNGTPIWLVELPKGERVIPYPRTATLVAP